MSVHLVMEASDKPGVVDHCRDRFPDVDAAIAYLRALAAVGAFDRPVQLEDGSWRLALVNGAGHATFRVVDDPVPGPVPR